VQQNVSVKASISRQIAEQLRSAIVAGQFKIGQRLPTEDELAKRFGVSRPSVREALKRLAAQNLVRARRGPSGGNFVVQPSYAELAESLSGAATLLVGMGALGIEEIIEARRSLQGSCLQLASSNLREEHLHSIETALQRQRDPDISDEDFCRADVAFHRALVDATDNGMLRFVYLAAPANARSAEAGRQCRARGQHGSTTRLPAAQVRAGQCRQGLAQGRPVDTA
jgi:DNA-binding FadR family transcriptional regulator